jgi:phospholipid/cholesterol/gamma-HCH transport system substrate-binding protein
LKVGIVSVVAVALIVFMVFAVGGQGGFWWQRYPLKARFSDVQGLKSGAVVRLSGKEVGSVKAVEFSGAEIDVRLEVRRDVRPLITTDSRAAIGSLSLLGEPIVDITASRTGRALGDDEYIPALPASAGIQGLTSSASSSLEQIDKLLTDVRAGRGTLGKLVTDDQLYTELTAFVDSAGAVTRALNQGKGTLGELVNDPAAYNALKTSLENLQVVTARLNSGQGALGRLLNDEGMGRSFAAAASNVEQVSGRLSRGEGTAGKLLTDQQLYDRLNSMANHVDAVMSGLDSGRGTAGRLLHDQQLYENMNTAVAELRGLLADVRKDPRKYLRVNVSIF